MIYYCHSSESTGKETGKTHLCVISAFNRIFLFIIQQKHLTSQNISFCFWMLAEF